MNLKEIIAELQLEHLNLNYWKTIYMLRHMIQHHRNQTKIYNFIITDYGYHDDFYFETLYELQYHKYMTRRIEKLVSIITC